jgi:hypothetical protein
VAKTIKTIHHPDGIARIFIIARDDGLFSYEGEAEYTEDGETFWAPAPGGGLFETAEAAETNARHEIPWLKRLT